MTDLAELGIRIQSHEVEVAADRMDDAAASATRLEDATDRVAASARYSNTALATMNSAVRQQNEVMTAARNATGLTSHEVMNLSRQFGDIGVSIASGMPLWMVAIQQGDQIRGTFAEASARGVGFGAALRSIGTSLGPLVIPLGLVAAAIGAVAVGFGLLNRELQKGIPDDITRGLGLTEEQLDRVKDKSVTFGDTVAATFTVIGRHIMDGPVGEALNWLGGKFGEVMDWIAKAWLDGWSLQIGVAVGAYRTIIDNWRKFPAALGEIVIDGVNAAIRAINDLVQGSIEGLNMIIDQANRLPFVDLERLTVGRLQEVRNSFRGATESIGSDLRENVTREIEAARAALISLGKEIGDEALARAVKRALDQAGDAGSGGRAGGRSEMEKQVEDTLRYIQSLKDQAATIGMNAIALKEYEIAQRALKAPTEDLRREIERFGEALVDKMIAEAANTRSMEDQLAMIRLEVRLIGAGNVERAKQIAQLAEIQRLRALGVPESDPAFAGSVRLAGEVAEEDIRRQQAQAAFQYGLEYTLDLTRQIDDAARAAGRGFEEAFGKGGGLIANLATGISGLNVDMKRIAEAERKYKDEVGANTDPRRIAMFEQERANITVAAYGDMITAAKSYFEEGSTGYRIMHGAEMAYRAYQMAASIQAIAQGWMETGSSVAQSGTKGAASIAAGAAKMFEMMGPLGFPAVAAMLGLLASLGLSGNGGGGGGRSAANDNEGPDHSTDAVRSYTAQDAAAREQATQSVAQAVRVQIEFNDPMFKARVQKEAVGATAPMVAAAAAGTKRDVFQTLNDRQVGNRKVSV